MGAQAKKKTSQARVIGVVALLVIAGIVAFVVLSGKSHSMSPVDIDAEVAHDGTIHYQMSSISSEQFGEARIVFSPEWLTAFDESKINDYPYPRTIQTEEEQWAEEANFNRTDSTLLIVVPLVISSVLLMGAIICYIRYGRNRKPTFTEEYWRDVPSPIDHPVVIARLWTQNLEKKSHLTVALMNLAQMGAIRIDKGSYTDPKGKMVEDYYVTRIPEVANTLTDPIDRSTMSLFFEFVARGKPSFWLKSIEIFGKEKPEVLVSKLKDWQKLLSERVLERQFFEQKSEKIGTIIIFTGIFYGAIGTLVCFVIENYQSMIIFAPAAIVLIALGGMTLRHSEEARNIYAKCEALRNWLTDFSTLDERPPTDVKVWGVFMVYAYIFGVATQVMEELRTTIPGIFVNTSVGDASDANWWLWFDTPVDCDASARTGESIGDVFSSSISNTVRSAQAAISDASEEFFEPGGGDGGFSGGGGDGFGGGGGGAR